MKRTIRRFTAALLTLALTFTVLPENFVWAKSNNGTVSAVEQTQTEGTEDSAETASENREKPYILSEIKEKREPNVKHFLMSDKSILAASYNQPVHTLVDGRYEEIDNSLVSSPGKASESAVLENRSNALKVKFAKKPNQNKLADIEYEGHTLSWALRGAQKVTARSAGEEQAEPDGAVQTEMKTETEPETQTGTAETETGSTAASMVTESSSAETERPKTEKKEEKESRKETDKQEKESRKEEKKEEKESLKDEKESVKEAEKAEKEEEKQNRNNRKIKGTPFDEKTVLKNLTSKVTYEGILKNVDLTYVIRPEEVKENLVLLSGEAPKEYVFDYETGDLSYRVTTEKTIELFDSKEPEKTVFTIAKPFMYDSGKKYSEAIEMKVEQTKKGMSVTLIPDQEFLQAADTVYPVTVDPMVSTSQKARDIIDNDITRSKSYSNNYLAPDMWVGSGYGDAYRTLIKFNNLPDIGSSGYIMDAWLGLSTFEADWDSKVQINVHKLTEDVDINYATWEEIDRIYDPVISDYQFCNPNSGAEFNITDIVNDWYRGDNYGLMLKVNMEWDDDRVFDFVSSDYGTDGSESEEYRPICVINYRDTAGLEDYWSYHTESIGRAATAYINDATAELTIQHTDFAENGNRLPLLLSRTFNMSHQDEEAGMGLRSGTGWRMSLNQGFTWEHPNGVDYAVYTDADGTKHYFCENTGWKDEDGLGLRLNFYDGDYNITDKNNTIVRFVEADGGIYLTSIEDSNGNSITVNYAGEDYHHPVSVTDGAGRVTKLSYNAEGRLSVLTDPADRQTKYEYSAGTPGEDPRFLTKIVYPDGEYTRFDYYFPEDSKHVRITASDGSALNFDVDGRYKTYEVTAYGTDGEEKQLYSIESKSANVTRYSYSDGLYEDYQFDHRARLVSVLNSEGYATYGKYADSAGAQNRVTLSSNVQKSVNNYMINGNAERNDYEWDHEGWGDYAGVSAGRTTADVLKGNYSFWVTKTSTAGHYHNRQYFDLEKGATYTYSGYIKTDLTAAESGAQLYVTYYNDNGEPVSVYSEPVEDTRGEWQRVSLTFTNGNSTNRVYFFTGITPGASGTAYFDNLQVEDGAVMNRYNYVENGGFERGGGNIEFYENAGLVGSEGLKGGGAYAVRIYGEPHITNNTAKEFISLNVPSDTNIVVGAWARADAVSMDGLDESENGVVDGNERLFGLEAEIHYTDGEIWRQCVKFNDALSSGQWQYISGAVNLSPKGNRSADKTVDWVKINAIYKGQVNYAEFDQLAMYMEEFGQTYAYDENGNLTSSADIAEQSGNFDYGRNNTLTKIQNPTGTSYEYQYDDKKNLMGAVNSEGVRCQFQYDNFGNAVSSVIQSDYGSASVYDGGIYYIRNKNSGKYLDSDHGIYTHKNVKQADKNWTASQMWMAESTGDGYFRFIPQDTPEYAMDIAGSSSANGANIQLYPKTDSDDQKYKVYVNPEGDGSCGILTKRTNCEAGLDVTDALLTDGANVAQWTYGKDGMYTNQVWYFEKVPEDELPLQSRVENTAIGLNGKTVYLLNRNSNKAVQVCSDVDAHGALVKQYERGTDNGMQWRIENAGGGYVYFVSMCSASKRVLGFPNVNTYTDVALLDNDHSDRVKFKIVQNENGSYRILSKANEDQCLAVLDATHENDGSVIAFPYVNAGVDREWYLQEACVKWSDEPQADKSYYIESVYNAKVFDIPTQRNDTGALLTQHSFNGGENQKFRLSDCGNGYFQLQPHHSTDGKVLSAERQDGLYTLKLSPKGTGINQQFKFIANEDGTYRLVNRSAGNSYVAEIPDYSNAQSEVLQMTYNTGEPEENQRWALREISEQMTSSASYTEDGNYLASVTDALGGGLKYDYNTVKGTLNSVTDANNVRTSYTYNAQNDSMTSVSQAGSTVSYTYDKDRLNTITTGNGTVYAFGYDNFNRNNTVKVGNRVLTSRMFDSQGRLSQSTYGNGQSIGYTYDKLGRVTEKKYNGTTKATYLYDNDGNVAQTTDSLSGITTRVSYDAIKRPFRLSLSNGQRIGFSYDDKNRVSEYTSTVGGIDTKTTFGYTQTSLIKNTSTTHENLKVSQEYSFDSLSRIHTKKMMTNDDAETNIKYTYLKGEKAGTTTDLIETIESPYGLSYKYEYDTLGNITRIYEKNYPEKEFTEKVSYTYDELNQLKTETRDGVTTTYTYDQNGNILSRAGGNNGAASSYTYGDGSWKDKLTAFNGQPITYDAIGNPLTYRDGMSFTWTNGRSLATYKKGNTTAAYTYNVDGVRTKKVVNGVTTDYYLNGSDIATQITGEDRLDFAYDENGNVYGFFYQDIPYLYVRNGQGDITGIIDDSGDVVVYYEYDSWGKVTKVTDYSSLKVGKLNPFLYRGYYYDWESGLYYLQSRYYDAETGRFLNSDTVIGGIGSVDEMNLFQYCKNNPVMLRDDTGHWPKLSQILRGAAIAAAVIAVAVITVAAAPVVIGVGAVATGTLAVGGIMLAASSLLLASSAGVELVEDNSDSWESDSEAANESTEDAAEGDSETSKYNLKKVKNNKEANKIAKRFGYDGAEQLKEDFVPKNGSKFNIKYDSKTGEIVLESIKDSSVQVPTGLFIE